MRVPIPLASDGAQTAAGGARAAGGGGGELRVGAAEALRGVHGAEAEAGVPEHEGHDGPRVSPDVVPHEIPPTENQTVNKTFCPTELKRASGAKRS